MAEWTKTENQYLEMPPDLAGACAAAGLTVALVDFEGREQAVLLDDPFRPGEVFLGVGDVLPRDRQLLIVRQALADLGAPGFEDVSVEPFGRWVDHG